MNKTNHPLRGILVGLGNHGQVWNNVCNAREDVEIVAFVGRSETSRQLAISQWGVENNKVYATLPEAINSCQADFVLDVTPPSVHRQVALDTFAAGLPLLGEKPLSDGLVTAREIVEAGEAAGCIHMVAQQQRFNPLIRTARRLLTSDTIGPPGQVDISFAVPWADWPGTHYVTEPFMFLLDMGCHHFDMIRYFLGMDPESVHVISWNLPWGWHQGDACHVAVFDFCDGLKVVHRATGCTLGEKTSWLGNWHADGPAGSMSWHENKILISHEHRANPPHLEEVPVDFDHPRHQKDPLLDEFLSAITEKREPECSGRDNLSTMSMTFAALESAKTGRPVKIESLS